MNKVERQSPYFYPEYNTLISEIRKRQNELLNKKKQHKVSNPNI